MWFKDNKVYETVHDIRNELINVSIPANATDKVLAELGFLRINVETYPMCLSTQTVIAKPIEVVNGVPTQSYEVVDKPDDVVKQEAKDAAIAYLAETDWVEPYVIRHELKLEELPADSEKLVIATKRKEAKAILAS